MLHIFQATTNYVEGVWFIALLGEQPIAIAQTMEKLLQIIPLCYGA